MYFSIIDFSLRSNRLLPIYSLICENMKKNNAPKSIGKTAAFILTFIMVYIFLSHGESVLMNFSQTSGHAKEGTHLFGGIDYKLPFPVYYINMNGSEDRRQRTELLFGNLWDLRRSPAVAGSDSEALMELMGVDNYQRTANYIQHERYDDEDVAWNEAGCTLSHLNTIRKAYLDSNEVVMVMEDDVSPALM